MVQFDCFACECPVFPTSFIAETVLTYLLYFGLVCWWRREWQTTSVFLPWESHEQYERQKDMILKDELPRSVGAQYAPGEEWRNNSRKNEEMEPKRKQRPVVDVTGDGSKVWCYKEQYCIGTWNVRSIPYLSFIELIFAWNVPLVSQIVLKRSLVFPILLFSSISLYVCVCVY